jgi:hypothetical protein
MPVLESDRVGPAAVRIGVAQRRKGAKEPRGLLETGALLDDLAGPGIVAGQVTEISVEGLRPPRDDADTDPPRWADDGGSGRPAPILRIAPAEARRRPGEGALHHGPVARRNEEPGGAGPEEGVEEERREEEGADKGQGSGRAGGGQWGSWGAGLGDAWRLMVTIYIQDACRAPCPRVNCILSLFILVVQRRGAVPGGGGSGRSAAGRGVGK